MFDPDINHNLQEVGFVLNSIKSASYLGIFVISVFVSYLIPLPEAIALVIFGYAGAVTELNIVYIFLASFLGLLLGDNILYKLSYMGSGLVKRFERKMRSHKLIAYEHLVLDNVGKTVYFLRLISGVRFFGPMITGTLGASWNKFVWANVGATFLNTAIFIWLGYFLHNRLLALVIEVEVVRNTLLFFSAFIVGFLLRTFRKKA